MERLLFWFCQLWAALFCCEAIEDPEISAFRVRLERQWESESSDR